jgi:radical SAM superfamily enzyme YgiQ (UPF0313 family)
MIVFLNPPLSLKERYADMGRAGSFAPPLGLCSLAAVTRENNIDTVIIDAPSRNLGFPEVVSMILKLDPSYVGITAATVSINNAARIAEMIKEKNSKIKIIVGGPHLTAVPEETMRRFPQIDIGVIGEGELTLIDLIHALENNDPLREIKGLAIRHDTEIEITPPRPYIEDLDSLPLPAWDLLLDFPRRYRPAVFSYKKLPTAALVASRGCPGKCIFCDAKVFGNRLRGHSASYLMRMIKDLRYNYGIKEIMFYDDTFVAFKSRLKELCNILINEDADLSWSCYSRVDLVDPDILKLMKKAGCWQIAYGIESGSQKILDFLKKGITLEQIRKALHWTKSAGIRTKGFFMMGNISETPQTIKETVSFAKRVYLDDMLMTIFTPLPGSQSYEIAEQYGTFEKDWSRMNLWEAVFVPQGFSKEEIAWHSKNALISFYFRPSVILSYLKMINNFNQISAIYIGVKSIISAYIKALIRKFRPKRKDDA